MYRNRQIASTLQPPQESAFSPYGNGCLPVVQTGGNVDGTTVIGTGFQRQGANEQRPEKDGPYDDETLCDLLTRAIYLEPDIHVHTILDHSTVIFLTKIFLTRI